jgi:copper(I)-binding protein
MHRRTFLIAAAAFGAVPHLAHAHGFDAGTLHIGHPWTRPTLRGQNAAGYLSLENRGNAADALIGVQCPLAMQATLHASSMAGGIMSMRAVAAIPVAPGRRVTLAPGGLHIMFESLRGPFADGALIAATLRFRRAGPVPVQFRVQRIAPTAGGHSGHGGHAMPGMGH